MPKEVAACQTQLHPTDSTSALEVRKHVQPMSTNLLLEWRKQQHVCLFVVCFLWKPATMSAQAVALDIGLVDSKNAVCFV